MTDGQDSYAPDQVPMEQAIRPFIRDGILRYAVGIGSEINPLYLKLIADDNVVLATNFDELLSKIGQQIGQIGKGTCKGMLYLYKRTGKCQLPWLLVY